jgi:type III restriction enzyme
MICKRISKNNAINDSELDEYIGRIMSNMTEDQLTDLEQSYYPYMIAIEKKINSLLDEYAAKRFEKLLEQEHIICKPMYHFPNMIAPTKTITAIPKSLYSAEEQFDNEYEKKVVWELSALDNIKWWHRNIVKKGFAINGAVTAYPDLIAMTTSGKILVIETKGDQLKNDESKIKSETGAKWAAKASMTGKSYKYYMVFQTKNPDYEGAYSYERFMEIVKEL